MLPQSFQFSPLSRRSVEAQFSGDHISGHSGLLLLREVDRRLGLSRRLARLLKDQRQIAKVQHNVQTILQQRLFGLAAGFEDLNDDSHLRDDFGMQTSVNRMTRLASTSTLYRFEAEAERQAIIDAHKELWDTFIRSHAKPPAKIILDFNATDVLLHFKTSSERLLIGANLSALEVYC